MRFPRFFLSALTVFDDRAWCLRRKVIGLYCGLIIANGLVWAWAFTAFYDQPLLLATGLIAYGFGLRHAVDADHIAAIDNVARKLMQEGKRPITVGFFFALGHSSVVLAASIVIASTAAGLHQRFPELIAVGDLLGTSISALFLFAVAMINSVVLVSVCRVLMRVRRGEDYAEDQLNGVLARRGLLTHLFRTMFRLISRSWHMYPLGFLFGLGFDTATEIGLLGISAVEASKGLPIWSILVFPALFAAGMSVVDTSDGVLMVGAYGWAFTNAIRKLYYNLMITGISVIIAVTVGAIEVFGLIAEKRGISGEMTDFAARYPGAIGYSVIGIFAASWFVSCAVGRAINSSKIRSA